jgi:formamidopyrimidine-DNA glycosylase
MIAGRLLWKKAGARPAGKIDLAAFEFAGPGPPGTLILTEAGTTKRASLHIVRGAAALAALDPGGIEPMTCTPPAFHSALTRESRTLKRALTAPALLSGIGNAYSDEILHAARLSPVSLTRSLSKNQSRDLLAAARTTLARWITALRREFGMIAPGDREPAWDEPPPRPGRFPGVGEVTAFRPDFAVHGRHGLPCPVCGSSVQRIVHADNETNYCATCQTGGRVLADRSLSRLLKEDWPRTIEEWEAIEAPPGTPPPRSKARRKSGPARGA